MSTLSMTNKVLFKSLEKAKFGSIRLRILEPFAEYQFGEGPLVAEVSVDRPETLQRVVRGSDIELASAIVKEELTISDEAAFIAWACKNEERLSNTFYGRFLGMLMPRLKKWFRPNTIDGAKRNIMAHYDLGNEFYDKWLDASMSYSAALFNEASCSGLLFEAQQRKYDRIIDELNITSNDRILEIGCGWGGFYSRAVERTGCKVTAVLNSPAQASYGRKLVGAKKLEAHVDLKLMDYRQIEGKFSKVVSIEMIEAVGQKYWPVYFAKISNSLRTGGRAMIQSITIQENKFADYARTPDFISTMVFPGGMLLTNGLIEANARGARLQPSSAPFEFGQHYAETLRRWRGSFLEAWDAGLLSNFDNQFRNLWRFYLAYCEGAFTAGRVNVGHFLMEKA